MKLGIIAFGNDSGLGNQTRRLVQLLMPYRILLIDPTPFSKNKQLHKEWFDGFNGYIVKGFPSNRDIKMFLNSGITHVLMCENPLNFTLYSEARNRGIKTYCQTNYEFCDNLNRKDLPLPYMFVMPSFWKISEMKNIFGDSKVTYLPPPINPIEFSEVRSVNMTRNIDKLRLLHIVGTLAVHDRNGTLDLIESLKYTNADFELVIKSQHELPNEYITNDRRVMYDIGNTKEVAELYRDFDALILPRRYGGLSLTTNEALISGLPVIMTNISPNNELLPEEWLINVHKKDSFFARISIDVFGVNPKDLAEKIDWLSVQDLGRLKIDAFDIGYKNFSDSVLRSKYEELWLL